MVNDALKRLFPLPLSYWNDYDDETAFSCMAFFLYGGWNEIRDGL